MTQLTHVASDRAAASPDWSADGKQIAYESNQSGRFQIWVMNADGSAATQLTRERGYEDFRPTFSPMGSGSCSAGAVSPSARSPSVISL